MKRKILVIALSTSLVFGQFDFKDYLGGFSNTTPAQTWTSDIDQGLLVTGGAYEYRYAFNGNMKPLFAAAAPSVKVGCGSIGIDGGFLALLGLDDIEMQFTDASAAFAFGFMSALEFTMPEISAIIAKLQEWARMLQDLLGGACDRGKRMGEKFAANLFREANNEVSKEGPSSFIGITMNPSEQSSKFTDMINSLPGGEIDTSSVTQSSKQDTIKKIRRTGAGSSLMLSIFGNYLPEFSNSTDPSTPAAVMEANLEEFLKDKKIGNHNLVFDSSVLSFEEKKSIYLLTKILFGEVYASDATTAYMRYHFDGEGRIKPNSLKNDLNKVVHGGEGHHIAPGFLKGSPYSPEEIASALMYGFNKISSDGTNDIQVSNNKLIYVDAKIDTGAGGRVTTDHNSTTPLNTVPVSSDTNNSIETIKSLMVLDSKANDFTVTFEGFRDGSLAAIKHRVEGTEIEWSHITVPNAVPGMGKYLKTLRLMYKKNNSDLAVQTMERNLADLNAYYVADSFISHLESMVNYQKNNAKVSLDKEGVETLRDSLNKLSERIKKIRIALRNKVPSVSDIPAINKDFEMLDQLIKENISRTIGE